jgi:D-amino-acid oxidase
VTAHIVAASTTPVVVVVGGGVIGLSTALRLQQCGYSVRIVAHQHPSDTTSAVAGATWFPYQVDPPERATAWTAASRPVFAALAAAGKKTGVVIRSCAHLWRRPVERRPWWADAVPDLTRLPEGQLPPGFADSYRFSQAVIDMPVYLSYLLNCFRGRGGEYLSRRLASLSEAARYGQIVVNCSGLGARTLAGDTELHPVRGQWLRVANPGIDWVLADFDHPDGEAYVIPHRHSCILGGTAEKDSWDTDAADEISAQIRERCIGLDPRLAHAQALEQKAGLRPVRRGGVRVELTTLSDGTPCVHNYGHGGAGVTLSWGCADEVVDLLRSPQSFTPTAHTTTG